MESHKAQELSLLLDITQLLDGRDALTIGHKVRMAVVNSGRAETPLRPCTTGPSEGERQAAAAIIKPARACERSLKVNAACRT